MNVEYYNMDFVNYFIFNIIISDIKNWKLFYEDVRNNAHELYSNNNPFCRIGSIRIIKYNDQTNTLNCEISIRSNIDIDTTKKHIISLLTPQYNLKISSISQFDKGKCIVTQNY